MSEKRTPITKENLLEFGFKKTDSSLFPVEKVLIKNEETNEPVLSFVVEKWNGGGQIGLISEAGHIIYLQDAESIEDLDTIEKSISGYAQY